MALSSCSQKLIASYPHSPLRQCRKDLVQHQTCGNRKPSSNTKSTMQSIKRVSQLTLLMSSNATVKLQQTSNQQPTSPRMETLQPLFQVQPRPIQALFAQSSIQLRSQESSLVQVLHSSSLLSTWF